jgi:uncharacterized protein YndB with AHSA1/START domain
MSVAPVVRATHVRRAPAEVFALFTDHIGAWWPLPTHGIYGNVAGGLAFEDGRLVERSTSGERNVWGEVLAWEPPRRVVFSWHVGRDEGSASEVEVRFTPDDDGTRVELIHRGWEAYGDEARFRRQRYVGPSAWGYVLDHFADLADHVDGRVGGADPGELATLAAAYDAFFAVASAGGFGPPPDGEWPAELVVAHVAVNDDALSAVCRGLVAQSPGVRLDNAVTQDVAVLQALVDAHDGKLEALVETGRARAAVYLDLLGRLDEDQLATEVPTRIVDHGDPVLDRPMPWGPFAIGTQRGFHLRIHREQLESLRTA